MTDAQFTMFLIWFLVVASCATVGVVAAIGVQERREYRRRTPIKIEDL